MLVYKIRRESDGKFSTGSKEPSFEVEGKRWPSKQHLTAYLMNLPGKAQKIYGNCVVVAVEVTETEVEDSISVEQHIKNEKGLMAQRQRKAKERQKDVEKQKRLEEYKKLKAEFG